MRRYVLLLAAWMFALALPTIALLPQPLRTHMLDVGQGDALLVQTPHGRSVLIDGGPNRQVLAELDRVLAPGASRIDLVFLTHPHADHFEGLTALLESWDVGRVLLTGDVVRSAAFLAFLRAVEAHGTPVTFAHAPMRFTIDGARIDVLAPQEALVGTIAERPNDRSMVVALRFGETQQLFMGDLETPGERALLSQKLLLRSDVLKVGHHGSKTSTSAAFLDAVAPDIALVSVGAKNPYRHPNDAVLSRIEASGAVLLRSDIRGTVTITCTESRCAPGRRWALLPVWEPSERVP